MDKIIIKDLKVFAYHGVNPEEKVDGQNFILDIICDVDLSVPCKTDNVDDTVSYAQIIKRIVPAFTAEKFDLIEKAAQTVCDTVLENFSRVESVEVTLKKPEAPMKWDFGFVAVNIRRSRND